MRVVRLRSLALLVAALAIVAAPAMAQNAPTKPKFDVYGFAQLDFGYPDRPDQPRLVRRDAAHQAAGLRRMSSGPTATRS